MNDFVICTDSACDLPAELLREWDVGYCNMNFKFDGDPVIYTNGDMTPSDFYRKMREGKCARTAAINSTAFSDLFESYLQRGLNVLYIGFSGGLSATCGAAYRAGRELEERYPDRRVITVDSLSGSVGQGLLVWQAVQGLRAGKEMEEIEQQILSLRTKVCHWVMVEDLVYLKRGGRISPTVAFVGKALGLKPLLRITDEGKIHSHSTVRGRKNMISALAEKYGAYAEHPANGTVFISHADCRAEAQALADTLLNRYNVNTKVIADIGPVLGAHAGPGTLVLCFVGKER